MEFRRLQRHGNSIACNIPPAYLGSLKLKEGDYVSLTLTVKKRIIIEPQLNPKQ